MTPRWRLILCAVAAGLMLATLLPAYVVLIFAAGYAFGSLLTVVLEKSHGH